MASHGVEPELTAKDRRTMWAKLEHAKKRVKRLEEAISDALLALGTGECRINQCDGCKADEDAAREGLRTALAEES